MHALYQNGLTFCQSSFTTCHSSFSSTRVVA